LTNVDLKQHKSFLTDNIKDLTSERTDVLDKLDAIERDIHTQLPHDQIPPPVVDSMYPNAPYQLTPSQLIAKAEACGLSNMAARYKKFQMELEDVQMRLTEEEEKDYQNDRDTRFLLSINRRRGEMLLGFDRDGRSYWSIPVRIENAPTSQHAIYGVLVNEPSDKTKWYTFSGVDMMIDFYQCLCPQGLRENSLRQGLYTLLNSIGLNLKQPPEYVVNSHFAGQIDCAYKNFQTWLHMPPFQTVSMSFLTKYAQPVRDALLNLALLHTTAKCNLALTIKEKLPAWTKVGELKDLIKTDLVKPEVMQLKPKDLHDLDEINSLSHLYSWISTLIGRVEQAQQEFERDSLARKKWEASEKQKALKQQQVQKEKEKESEVITSRSGRKVVLPPNWTAVPDGPVKAEPRRPKPKAARKSEPAETSDSVIENPKKRGRTEPVVHTVASSSGEEDSDSEPSEPAQTPKKYRGHSSVATYLAGGSPVAESPVVESSPEVVPKARRGGRAAPRQRKKPVSSDDSETPKKRPQRARRGSMRIAGDSDQSDNSAASNDSEEEETIEAPSRSQSTRSQRAAAAKATEQLNSITGRTVSNFNLETINFKTH
jgi:hypothetical protein